MQIDLAHLPTDQALLHHLVRDMASCLEQRNDEIERLQLIIHGLQRSQFGSRSEQLSEDQLALALEDLQTDLGAAVARAARSTDGEATVDKRAHRAPLPPHLPREEKLLDIDEQSCADCGGALHFIANSESEMLDWLPAQLRVLKLIRPKWGCRNCNTVHQRPAPPRAIAGGLATPALLAQVITAKYCDHTPLYRQSQIFARHGIDLERSTLADWVGGACWWLDALHEELRKNVVASTHLFADDTPVPVLDPGRGRTKVGRFWVYARDDRRWAGPEPPAALYLFETSRQSKHPSNHLAGFSGVLQVDGYTGFKRLTRTQRVLLAACWSHARRKFEAIAEATQCPISNEALRRIGELYVIEKRIAGQSADERRTVRRAESMPVLTAMEIWLQQQLRATRNRSNLANAIRYTLRRWADLLRFVEDGRIELDSNTVERAIRSAALGRKNHLFAGSAAGGQRWATIGSLIETCKLNGVEPYAYLKDVLEKMVEGYPANRLHELMPWAWKAYATTAI
jgi:transposase